MQSNEGMDEEKGKGLNAISWSEHQPRICGEQFYEFCIYEVTSSFSLKCIVW